MPPLSNVPLARMGRRQMVLAVLVTIFFLLFHASSNVPEKRFARVTKVMRGERQFEDLVLRPKDRTERITLISVFGGNKGATYLPMFFQTVGQNAKSVDLLFVNVDQGAGCIDLEYITSPSSTTFMPNIKVLCLSEEENDSYYQNFICNGWGGCNHDDAETVKDALAEIRKEAIDEIFNTFKPFRGLVYEQHLTTSWWAWCDADQLIGRMEHFLPWDIMNNFDMVLTQGFAEGPKALFMSGQLTIFRINERMRKIPFRYKPLSSVKYVHDLKPGDHLRSLDEGEYSDLFINKLPEVDILRLPDIMGPEPNYGDRRIVVVDGHILSGYRHISREDIQHYFNMINDPDARNHRIGNTLTKYGHTIPVALHNDVVMFCNGDRWNPINTCPDWLPSHAMRSLMYRKNGIWKIRRDVRIHSQHEWLPQALEPKMFVHFLQMKREADEFKMPDMQQSGYARQRKLYGDGQDELKMPGRQVAVFEMTRDWAGTWVMTAQSKQYPRGFDWTHKYMRKFWTEDDAYWPYNHYEIQNDVPSKGDPPDPYHHVLNVAEVVDAE